MSKLSGLNMIINNKFVKIFNTRNVYLDSSIYLGKPIQGKTSLIIDLLLLTLTNIDQAKTREVATAHLQASI